MAQRRMISQRVFNSDSYLELSIEARALYPALMLVTDDDGFIDNARMILRVHQIPPSALDELVEAGLLIAFDGVYVIAHWGLQNSVKNDRYKPTQYIEEFSSLENIEGVYKLKKQPSTCNGSNMEPTGNQTGTLTELNLTEHNKTNTGKGSARGNLKSHKDNSPSSASLQKIGKEEKRCFACGGNLIHTKDGAVYCFDCQMTYETAESAKRER